MHNWKTGSKQRLKMGEDSCTEWKTWQVYSLRHQLHWQVSHCVFLQLMLTALLTVPCCVCLQTITKELLSSDKKMTASAPLQTSVSRALQHFVCGVPQCVLLSTATPSNHPTIPPTLVGRKWLCTHDAVDMMMMINVYNEMRINENRRDCGGFCVCVCERELWPCSVFPC